MSRGRGRPRPSSASCVLCPLSPMTEGGKPQKTGRAPFMPLCEWIALFSGSFLCADQTDSGGLNLIISLFPCSLINPHSSCTTLPCFILRLSATQSSWNATLTKPSAKCIIISQYVVFFSKGIKQFSSELINRVTLHGFGDVYEHLFLK